MPKQVLPEKVANRKPSSPSQSNNGRNDGLIRQVKGHLFELYKADHWPSDLEEDACLNYDDKGGCHEQGKTRDKMCPSCATYDRLMAEFNAIPAW